MGVTNHSNLWRYRSRINDRIFFGQQDTVIGDTHLSEDIHGLFSDRPPTNNQWLDMSAVKLAHPSIIAAAKTTVLMNQRIM
jgi:hypothetical protein